MFQIPQVTLMYSYGSKLFQIPSVSHHLITIHGLIVYQALCWSGSDLKECHLWLKHHRKQSPDQGHGQLGLFFGEVNLNLCPPILFLWVWRYSRLLTAMPSVLSLLPFSRKLPSEVWWFLDEYVMMGCLPHSGGRDTCADSAPWAAQAPSSQLALDIWKPSSIALE